MNGDAELYIQSERFLNGVVIFLIKIFESLKFETYHAGVKCTIPSLSRNRITKLDCWSKLDEVLRYLNLMEIDTKKMLFMSIFIQWVQKLLANQFIVVK